MERLIILALLIILDACKGFLIDQNDKATLCLGCSGCLADLDGQGNWCYEDDPFLLLDCTMLGGTDCLDQNTISDQSKCEWGEWKDTGCNTSCGRSNRFKFRNKKPVESHTGICSGLDTAWEECNLEPCQCAAKKQPCDTFAIMGQNDHRICCKGLACTWGQCEKNERQCDDAFDCKNPGVSINSTYIHKSLFELYPDGCNELPRNHGIYGIDQWGGSLKFRCPKSCGCKKCNSYNFCIQKEIIFP